MDSGLMGLSFASLSVLHATPFWGALYHAGLLSEPLFSFYLERYINQPLSRAVSSLQTPVCTRAPLST